MIVHEGHGMLLEADRAPIDLVFVRCSDCGGSHAWWIDRRTGRRLQRVPVAQA
jgi:hypothetical protein